MSTNAYVYKTIEGTDKVQGLYIHWDGYPAYVGQVLLDDYQDNHKLQQLMQLKQISCLGKFPKMLDRNYRLHLYEITHHNGYSINDSYGYTDILDALDERYCSSLGGFKVTSPDDKHLVKYLPNQNFDDLDTTLTKVIDENKELNYDCIYLFKNNKWHRWSERKGNFVEMTQSWIDKYGRL